MATDCGKGDYDDSDTCSDCNSDYDCKKDKGAYEPVSDWDSVSNTTECDNTYYSDWEFVHAVNPVETSTEPYDQNQLGTNKITYINGWFEDRPDTLLDEENCDHWESPRPLTYYVHMRHPKDEYDQTDYEFRKPRPDGDSSSTWDPVVEVAMGLVSGATSSSLLTIAALAAPHFINENTWSPVNWDEDEKDLRQIWDWSIQVDQWPDSGCDTSDVRFHNHAEEVQNGAKVHSWGKFAFDIPTYADLDCRCSDPVYNRYETDWVFRDYCFDIIE